MSELLLSRQGPLAHVWLASNYDKKLSKHQLLSTNIVTSSNIISSKQLHSLNVASDAGNTITLRLSGQLLLGIVKIYSRKTKYLLDDINETLYKLKNSFKYASGATLGTSTAITVNLPPQQTTLTNLSRTLLQDQVTDLDLFYQDDLRLDEPEETTDADALLSLVSSFGRSDEVADFDRSVEVARGDDAMEMDFDLNLDDSIEQGRDIQVPMSEGDTSILDLGKEQSEEGIDTALDFDLDEPLETIEEQASSPHLAEEPLTPQAETRPRRRLVGVMEDGAIKTTKRRLVVDNEEDLEGGLPNNVLRSIQHMQTYGGFSGETLTLKLSELDKISLIYDLAETANMKRRRIWNLDEQLRQTCAELADQEQEQSLSPVQTTDYDFDNNLDFDLSLPGLGSDDILQSEGEEQNEGGYLNGIENLKGTIQVAEHLRKTFFDQPTVTLQDLIQKDLEDRQNTPLGATRKTDTGIKVSQKREATRCFFELLVLASHDCVSLDQDKSELTSQLGTDLSIRPRDKLISNFV